MLTDSLFSCQLSEMSSFNCLCIIDLLQLCCETVFLVVNVKVHFATEIEICMVVSSLVLLGFTGAQRGLAEFLSDIIHSHRKGKEIILNELGFG